LTLSFPAEHQHNQAEKINAADRRDGTEPEAENRQVRSLYPAILIPTKERMDFEIRGSPDGSGSCV